jgi:uncharacterized protein YndB with AHSA1/START domain
MKPINIPALHLSVVLLGAAMVSAAAARAETSGVSPAGFVVHVHRDVSAAPHKVYETIARIGKWWNSAHTWSGDAGNLSLDLNAGGCFCERWGANSVMHGQVIFVVQDEVLRLQSSLGPLQQRAVNGVLTFTTKPAAGKTALDLTYKVVGNADSGLDQSAPGVEKVLDEQVTRLVSLIETGMPESAADAPK